jgi:hypothetical protein
MVTQEDAAILRPFPHITQAPVTVLTGAGHVFNLYGIKAIPYTIFFNAQGEVAAEIEGFNEAALDALEKHLRKG